jgi:glycerol-3-phosphate acyltransferase PlsX
MTRSDRSPQDGSTPSGTARIAVDLLGGDGAPAVVVDGALQACSADPDLHLHLVGPLDVADEVIGALAEADRHRVTVNVVDAVVHMAEAPLRSVRRASTVRAAVAASAHVLGRFTGVRRPALAVVLPSVAGPLVLLDVGVGLDATMMELVQHAVLGTAYAGTVLKNLKSPRVGLLSVGSEPGKGDRLRRATALALTDLVLPMGGRYIGLVEGQDVPIGGPADVVVTDGFTGNVLLKGMEGAVALTGRAPSSTNAAVLLGVDGTVVICHGAATGTDVASGIALAARLHRSATIDTVAALAREPLTELASADIRERL